MSEMMEMIFDLIGVDLIKNAELNCVIISRAVSNALLLSSFHQFSIFFFISFPGFFTSESLWYIHDPMKRLGLWGKTADATPILLITKPCNESSFVSESVGLVRYSLTITLSVIGIPLIISGIPHGWWWSRLDGYNDRKWWILMTRFCFSANLS